MNDQRIINKLLLEIDETNFHVCGDCWQNVNDLLDRPGQTYGTIGAWVLAVAAEWHDIGRDDYEFLGERLIEHASQFVTFDLESLEGLPVGVVRERLGCLTGSVEREVA